MFSDKLPKLLRLPTVVKLGRAKINALGMRSISCIGPNEYSWEDYHQEMKAKYPFKYWLNNTAPRWFSLHISKPIEHTIYWIKCHTMKKHKFHLIDIRNEDYKWGYIDCDLSILYACFSILDRYVDTGQPQFQIKSMKDSWKNNEFCYGSEEADKKRIAAYEEILALHKWWHEERPALIKKSDEITSREGDKGPCERNYQESWDLDARVNEEEKNAIKRLADVRGYLWT